MNGIVLSTLIVPNADILMFTVPENGQELANFKLF
jgi:hypothetical protein